MYTLKTWLLLVEICCDKNSNTNSITSYTNTYVTKARVDFIARVKANTGQNEIAVYKISTGFFFYILNIKKIILILMLTLLHWWCEARTRLNKTPFLRLLLTLVLKSIYAIVLFF